MNLKNKNDFYFQDDSENLETSGSLTKKTRTYSKWSPMEEGITLAWNDLTVYTYTQNNKKQNHKRIINSGKEDMVKNVQRRIQGLLL